MGYGVVASVIYRDERLEEVRERGELHAGISTYNYEYLALEIGESVGIESHIQIST
jgi:hypothetical protein